MLASLQKRMVQASRDRDVLPVLYTRSRPQDCPRNTNPGVAIFARRSRPQAQVAMPRFVFLAGQGLAPAQPMPKQSLNNSSALSAITSYKAQRIAKQRVEVSC